MSGATRPSHIKQIKVITLFAFSDASITMSMTAVSKTPRLPHAITMSSCDMVPVMVIAYIPLLVCIVGLLMFALAKDKVARIGEHMLWTGLLVTLLTYVNKTLHL